MRLRVLDLMERGDVKTMINRWADPEATLPPIGVRAVVRAAEDVRLVAVDLLAAEVEAAIGACPPLLAHIMSVRCQTP
jgi:hypothetical protein